MPWFPFLLWGLVAAGALSWVIALYRLLFGVLGIPGLACFLNGLVAFAAVAGLRALSRRGSRAGAAVADLEDARGTAQFLQERVRFLEARTQGLQGQVELLSAVREMARTGPGETRFEPVVQEVFSIVGGLLPSEVIALYFPERQGGLRLAAFRSDGEIRFGQTDRALEGPDLPAAFSAWSVRRLHREGSDLAIPLVTEGNELGVLALRLEPGAPPEQAERVLRDLAKPLAIALQNPKLRRAALLDGLTGLFTKRHLLEQAPALVAQQREREEPLSLLMADLDHFKRINDTLGHPVGDLVLKEVSRRVLEAVRDSDTAYRYGGEEVVCLLPGAALPVAARVANRICRAVAEVPVQLPGREPLSVTISVGVATLTPEMPSWEDLLQAGDQALYQAKAAGRNRVVSFREKGLPG